MKKIIFAVLPLLFPVFVFSSSITIYNNDFALVKESKDFEIYKGVQKLEFSDVSSKIDPASVLPKFFSDADKISVLEQNYDYDLVDGNKLLQKYIGREITVERQNGSSKKEQITGTLLAVNGGIILQTKDNQNEKIIINPQGEVSLSGMPEDLMLKPTLSWLVDSKIVGKKSMEVSYKTAGFSWNADYVAVLGKDDKSLDLNVWVTINNTSGATYTDADLKLVAGDVNTVKDNYSARLMKSNAFYEDAAVAGASFEEKNFFEYHIYNLPRKTTLKNNEKKQIELTAAQGVPVEKKYTFNGSNSKKVNVSVTLKNNKTSNLGIPLPKGKIRVFKSDGKNLEFVGEDRIDHSPEGKEIVLNLGNSFDITAERVRKSMKKDTDGKKSEEAYEIKIENSKNIPIKVDIVENLNSYSSWSILSSSDKYVKKDSNTIVFNVTIPAKAKEKIEYRVKYTW